MDTKAIERDPLHDTNLQLGRCLKTALRCSVIDLVTLLLAVALVFWMLAASDDFIGTKLLLVALILGTLLNHCRHIMRNHQCESLVLKQLEITAKDRAKASRLYDLSILDPLTGLNNRRFGEQTLRDEISRCGRTGENLAVVLIDLDYFKEINDKYGHAVGDLALKEFSRSLRRAIRACDFPVRLGGDEFLLVLPDCPRDKVSVILQRIGTPIIECNREKIHVCYSSGIAQYQYGDTSESLLSRADEVLYAKKAARPLPMRETQTEPIWRK